MWLGNSDSVQLIMRDGRLEYPVCSLGGHMQPVEDTKMLADVRDYDAAMQAITDGEELIPAEVVYAIIDGANPIRVWREHRGLSQSELASQAGISPSYLSQLESGKRDGTMEVLAAIASALNVTLDDLAG